MRAFLLTSLVLSPLLLVNPVSADLSGLESYARRFEENNFRVDKDSRRLVVDNER